MLFTDKYVCIYFFTVMASLLLWLIGIFYGGSDSVQFKVFFAACDNFLADFTNVCGYSSGWNVYNNDVNGFGEKAYPPLPYVITGIFSRLDRGTTPAYTDLYMQPRFLIMFMVFCFFLLMTIYEIIRNNIEGDALSKYLLSLPIMFSGAILFTVERGNMILPSFLFMLIFWFGYESDRKIIREFSLLALGIAVAMKLSPLALALVLLYGKRFKDIGKVVLYGGILFIIPFFCFEGGLNNLFFMLRNMQIFFASYGSMTSMALPSFITLAANKLFIPGLKDYMAWSILWKCICLGSATLIAVTAWAMKRKWEKCLAISLILLLVPAVSHAYCSLYFIPALVMFLNEKKRENTDVLCLLGFVLICWTYMLPIKKLDFLAQCYIAIWCFYIFTMIKSLTIFKNIILTQKWRNF